MMKKELFQLCVGLGQRASATLLDASNMKYYLFFSDYEPELYDLKEDKKSPKT